VLPGSLPRLLAGVFVALTLALASVLNSKTWDLAFRAVLSGAGAEHLFDAIRNPTTGKPCTNAEVARVTLGDLSEEVEGIRTGAISDPTVGQVAALAGVFGVEHSYLLDRGEPLFDGEFGG